MPHQHELRLLPWSAEQLFDLVADVEKYPEFLPWVRATRIRSQSATLLVADMVVGFRVFRETFTSRVMLDRPRTIHVEYVAGPLRYLRNDWGFTPAAEGTMLEFLVDFEFRTRILEKLAGAFFTEAFRRMVSGFEQRAEALYGRSNIRAVRTA